MNEFDTKTVLLTGGTAGIGESAVRLFAESGANVCFIGRSREAGKHIENELNKQGGKTRYFHADITNEKELRVTIDEIIRQFKKINIVINCAGYEGELKEIKDTTIQEWDYMMNLHLRSCFIMINLIIPNMIKHGGGVIINTGSEIGTSFRFAPNYVPYATSKAAVMALTKALSVELAPYKIRVNCVSPGVVKTPMLEREIKKLIKKGVHKSRKNALKDITNLYPVGFIADPVDIARSILFLASEKSRFTTGAVLSVDGGGGII